MDNVIEVEIKHVGMTTSGTYYDEKFDPFKIYRQNKEHIKKTKATSNIHQHIYQHQLIIPKGDTISLNVYQK